jgi:hypothetical protein
MFWVPIRVQVSYSHSGFDSEKLYIGESSGRKLGFSSHSGSLSLRSRSGAVRVLFGCCSGAVRVLFGCCSGAVRVLFGCCSGAVRVLFGLWAGHIRVQVGSCSGLFPILARSWSNPMEVRSFIPSQIYKTIPYSLYSSSAWGYLKPSLI